MYANIDKKFLCVVFEASTCTKPTDWNRRALRSRYGMERCKFPQLWSIASTLPLQPSSWQCEMWKIVGGSTRNKASTRLVSPVLQHPFEVLCIIFSIIKPVLTADIHMIIFCSPRDNSTRSSSNATTYTDLSNTHSVTETATMKATEQGYLSACNYHIFKYT